jgi:cytoskeletal protein CcmA (bactofilin family)
MMFNRNKDKQPPTPDRPAVRSGSSVPSIIGSDIRVLGNLATPGEVQLDGLLEGDIVCGFLTVGEHGVVTGTVKAERLVLRGRIEGKIRAKTINFERSARIKGDVTYETMTMEAGVQIDGKLVPMSARDSTAEASDKAPAAPKAKLATDYKAPQAAGKSLI